MNYVPESECQWTQRGRQKLNIPNIRVDEPSPHQRLVELSPHLYSLNGLPN